MELMDVGMECEDCKNCDRSQAVNVGAVVSRIPGLGRQ
jgi:hypothetical protein